MDEKEIAAELEKLSTDQRAGTYFQVLVRVGGYIHAMSRLLELSLEEEGYSVEQVFYTEALYRMLADWFTPPDSTAKAPLADALTIVGLEEGAGPIQALMDAPLGAATCGAVARAFRNAQAGNNAFLPDLPTHIARTLSLDPHEMAEGMKGFLDAVFEEALDLQGTVERYFEDEYRALYKVLRSQDVFFSVLHHQWQPQASEG